jgi:hypothetical protein
MLDIELCPTCRRYPGRWHEKAAFNSRELWWIGCKEDGHLAGGITIGASIMQWNRMAVRIRMEKQNGSFLHFGK